MHPPPASFLSFHSITFCLMCLFCLPYPLQYKPLRIPHLVYTDHHGIPRVKNLYSQWENMSAIVVNKWPFEVGPNKTTKNFKFILFSKIKSHVAQASFEFLTLLSPLLKCWHYKHVPTQSMKTLLFQSQNSR